MTVKPVLHHKQSPDGKRMIYIRTIVDRKIAMKSTGIAIEQQFFNYTPKSGKYIRSAHPQADYINEVLSNLIRETEDKIRAGQTPGTAGRLSFYNHCEQYLELVRLKNYNTWKRFNSHIKSLQDFTNGDILFSQIDYEFLKKFETYLRREGNSVNTIHAKMKSIRAILYDAIRAGKAAQHLNAFFKYKIPSEKTRKERLSIEEIRQMERMILPVNTYLDYARDMFVFAFYCRGMRIGDVLCARKENITDGILKYVMLKTDTEINVLLMKEAKELIEKYKDSPKPFIFPLLDETDDKEVLYKQIATETAKINKALKNISDKCGFKINLSSHIARHSFASQARRSGKDIYKIMEMMGHNNVAITQNYVNSIADDELNQDTLEVYTKTKTA